MRLSPKVDEAVAQLLEDAKQRSRKDAVESVAVQAKAKEICERHKKELMPTAIDDPVDHPSHYKMEGQIECIEAIEASMTDEAFLGFLKGNVEKYIWRYEKKINPLEDLKKACWYLNKLIEKETIYKSEGEGNEGKN